MKNIPYREIFERMHNYVEAKQTEQALRCAQMKKLMIYFINGEIDMTAVADIAELALDFKHYSLAMEYAKEGLDSLLPFHAGRVRFYSVLIRALFNLDRMDEGEDYFQ